MDELARRQRKFEQIRAVCEADRVIQERWKTLSADRAAREPEAIALLNELRETLDLQSFRSNLDAWSRRPGYDAFSGFGLMFINQIVKQASSDTQPVASLLADVLSMPNDESGAARKISSLAEHVNKVKQGGHPAPARVPYVVSLFWSIQDHDRWPCMWVSGESVMLSLGWLKSSSEQAERYLRFREGILQFSSPPVLMERILWWFERHPFTGLDPSLLDRCAENADWLKNWEATHAYPGPDEERLAEQNATIIMADLRLLGKGLQDALTAAIGYELSLPNIQLRTSQSSDAPFRADGTVVWSLEGGMTAPSVRIWVTAKGIAVGVHPGWAANEQHERLGNQIDESPEGMGFFSIAPHLSGDRLHPVGPTYPGGELFFGRWLEKEAALDRLAFADDVVEIAKTLKPVLDRFVIAHGGKAMPPVILTSDDDLAPLVEEFRAQRPYPTEKDDWHKAQRPVLARTLSPDALATFDVRGFRLIANSNRYGRPGPQSRLNAALGAVGPDGLAKLGESLQELLWNDGDDAERIDRGLDRDDLGFSGLGESVIMKLLAIVKQERYLPVFPYVGEMGKRALMPLIGLTPPVEDSRTAGELQVLANDQIRTRLEPLFPNDPWGQAQFLYWLKSRGANPVEQTEIDVLGELAATLLLDRSFLEEIVQLLRDKGQVILYGPPGTGKTFIARKIAEALAPEPSRRDVVQFHPSTSYEDFFEGYRPGTTDEGQMIYSLARGPLALIAERAQETPGVEHVLIVDEINRANLPKVFGELLYLLEYREEPIQTLYRPDDRFELPENLLFIGTMNTADRSIGLIDAALRRRFHFVPVFPDRPPIEGLLERWLKESNEPTWIADLVDMVNGELRDRLGPHLQIGPSHFMKRGLTLDGIERIWKFNVYPLIEEQLHGDWAEIDEYHFDAVHTRFKASAAGETEIVEADIGKEIPEA